MCALRRDNSRASREGRGVSRGKGKGKGKGNRPRKSESAGDSKSSPKKIFSTPETCIIVVDFQHDFVEGGGLAVQGANHASYVPNVKRFIEACRVGKVSIAQAQDWHPANHACFANNAGMEPFSVKKMNYGNGEVDQIIWPAHCVQHTKGAELISDPPPLEYVVMKGADASVDNHSAFHEGNGVSTGLQEYLHQKGIKNVVVFGPTGDFCVYYTVLDSVKHGFRTICIPDLCCVVNPAFSLTEACKKRNIQGVSMSDALMLISGKTTGTVRTMQPGFTPMSLASMKRTSQGTGRNSTTSSKSPRSNIRGMLNSIQSGAKPSPSETRAVPTLQPSEKQQQVQKSVRLQPAAGGASLGMMRNNKLTTKVMDPPAHVHQSLLNPGQQEARFVTRKKVPGRIMNDKQIIKAFSAKTTAIVLCDFQYDFLEGGALAVPKTDYEEYVPKVRRFIDYMRNTSAFVTQLQNWHPRKHYAFATTCGMSPFQMVKMKDLKTGLFYDQVMWPDHCIEGTKGAELAIKPNKDEFVQRKGMDPKVDGYSAFYDVGGQPTGFAAVLKKKNIKTVVVLGVASDYCVNFTAMDSVMQGFTTICVADLCRSVNPQYNLVKECMKKECHITSSQDIYVAFDRYETSSLIQKMFCIKID